MDSIVGGMGFVRVERFTIWVNEKADEKVFGYASCVIYAMRNREIAFGSSTVETLEILSYTFGIENDSTNDLKLLVIHKIAYSWKMTQKILSNESKNLKSIDRQESGLSRPFFCVHIKDIDKRKIIRPFQCIENLIVLHCIAIGTNDTYKIIT